MYVPLGYTGDRHGGSLETLQDKPQSGGADPKAVAFPEGVEEVEITRVGANLIVSPVGKRWDDLFERGPRVSEDFLQERMQLAFEDREPL